MPVYQSKRNAFTIRGITYEKAATGTWFWGDQAVIHEIGAILDVLQVAVDSQCLHCCGNAKLQRTENRLAEAQRRLEMDRTEREKELLASLNQEYEIVDRLTQWIQELPPNFSAKPPLHQLLDQAERRAKARTLLDQENADQAKRIRELEAELASLRDVGLRAARLENVASANKQLQDLVVDLRAQIHELEARPVATARFGCDRTAPPAAPYVVDGTGADGKAPMPEPAEPQTTSFPTDHALRQPFTRAVRMANYAMRGKGDRLRSTDIAEAIGHALVVFHQAQQEADGG